MRRNIEVVEDDAGKAAVNATVRSYVLRQHTTDGPTQHKAPARPKPDGALCARL